MDEPIAGAELTPSPAAPELSSSSRAPVFEIDFQRAAQGLRGALIALFDAAGADWERPQSVSRTFNVDKSLAWKASRIVRAGDPVEVLRFAPGAAGFRILIEALERGAPTEAGERMRAAVRAFERMVEVHAGDRATLELFTRGLAHQRPSAKELEQVRKQAFLGNSGIWGVQARLQLSLTIAAPNALDPSMVDLARVAGLHDFQRLHSDARWLLFRTQTYDDSGEHSTEGVPLDPDSAGGMPLVRAFCSDPDLEIVTEVTSASTRYILPEGPVGRTAAFTCHYGSLLPALGPVFGDKRDDVASFGSNVETPAERLIVDVLVHEDIPWTKPSVEVKSTLDGSKPLWVADRVYSLGRGLDSLATPHAPRYPELAAWTFERLKLDPLAFEAYRFSMSYPPLTSNARICFAMPLKP